MKRYTFAILGTAVLCTVAATGIKAQQKAAPAAAPRPAATAAQTPAAAATPAATAAARPAVNMMPAESQSALLKQYCSVCHNDNTKSGGMTLTKFDVAHPEATPEITEKMIKKLRAGLMPPAGMKRPERDTVKLMYTTLESTMDRTAGLHPNPGSRPFQRLTRTEYARSIHDLLGIDEDVEALLPADTLSDGLDNIADNQQMSATLMEGYMRAALKVSRDAVGDPHSEPGSAVYKIDRTSNQLRHVEGAPFGTRGGISTTYNFPADGEYDFRALMHGTPTGQLFGWVPGEQLEVSLDGERIAILDIDPKMSESTPTGLNIHSGKIFVRAGAHRVSAAFPLKHSDLFEEDIAPNEHTLADTDIGDYRELTELPHLREFEISGPFNVTGVSDTPSRRRIFTCRPLGPQDEQPCATKIVTNLAKQAYRRPLNSEDMEGLMSFYEQGRKEGDFESGIRVAIQALLTSPSFVFRLERAPAGVKPGQTYRISDLELASRLSYFLWNTMPDDELMSVASQNRLRDPLVLDKQVKRMLKDPKSESLSTKFAGEWLHLPDLYNLHPDAFYYPFYDHTLAEGMKRETELFFDSIVREDHNVLDLLTANYTFLNERLAKHYGIPNVAGESFKRVELTDDYRKGLLGKGAILALTSVADRTSPVLRGKWVMGVILGTPPPAPPPGVPKLEETAGTADGKPLTVRERMEIHRAVNPCKSCHAMIDPVGLALENFDVTGQWRTLDKTASVNSEGLRVHTPGIVIDTKTQLYDGTPMDGPATLRAALLSHSDMVIINLTEKLMAYALGRRVEYFDMPLVREIDRTAAKNDNRFSSLILGIVKSQAFQMSKAQPVSTEAAK
jgi:hypothetical protein